MEWLTYDTANCSIKRTLEIIGEKWTLLILREMFNGVGRFDQIRDHIGISDSMLADRLRKLTDSGLITATSYREAAQRPRHEYRLTDKGQELFPILISLLNWGDAHLSDPSGAPVLVTHHNCGEPLHTVVQCAGGHVLDSLHESRVSPGPAAQLLGN